MQLANIENNENLGSRPIEIAENTEFQKDIHSTVEHMLPYKYFPPLVAFKQDSNPKIIKCLKEKGNIELICLVEEKDTTQ